jgi:AAA+ superfamily predicted ATPase
MNPQYCKTTQAVATPPGIGLGWKPQRNVKPKLGLKIKNIPKILPLYDPLTDLVYFNRIALILNKYGLSENSLLMNNPFDTKRLETYIGPKISSYGGIAFSYVNIYGNNLGLDLRCPNGFAEIEPGVYYLSYDESYVSSSTNNIWIVFDPKNKEWNESTITSFIKRFSKKLRAIKLTEQNCDKDAFNSIFLPDEILKNIREDIDNFLISRDLYKNDLKLAWRRGYMLAGSPGNGKTLLIRKVCEYYGLEHFDIRRAIERDGTLNFDNIHESSIDYLLYPEEVKPRVCVLEDIDKFVAFQSGEMDKDYGSISLHSLLKGMDGVDQFDDIILFATTNFPDILHEALIGRPGRFDKIYKVEKPTPDNIYKLLKYYNISIDYTSHITSEEALRDLAKELEGSSMAFVAEFVKLAKMKFKRNNITNEETYTILTAIKDHKKLCENHFKEPKSLGFKK